MYVCFFIYVRIAPYYSRYWGITMKHERKILLGTLFVATTAVAAWPAKNYYEPDYDGLNTANTQRMGYGALSIVGKV